MKVSPLDLRQVRFRTTFRGFDKAEVLALIAEVTDDYENALKDVDKLRQDVSKMEALLNQHREHERDLRDTLVTAQRVSDDIRANAEAQARNVIREAEGRSDLLLQKTQSRLEDVQREIDGMRMKRHEVETTLESTIASLRTRRFGHVHAELCNLRHLVLELVVAQIYRPGPPGGVDDERRDDELDDGLHLFVGLSAPGEAVGPSGCR